MRHLLRSCLEIVYPETCVQCGAEFGERPWCPEGPRVNGLGWSEGAHLCRACALALAPAPVRTELAADSLPVHGGRRPSPIMVRVLGDWKYRGVRGLAWPLADLAAVAVAEAIKQDGAVDWLVPVSLHGRRRRERGFNQAEVLARLVGRQLGLPVETKVLRRLRQTRQQAKLKTAGDRQRNLLGAFQGTRGPGESAGARVGLLDDLITSGATCQAAARALTAQGWHVVWCAALGVAAAAGDGSGRDDASQ